MFFYLRSHEDNAEYVKSIGDGYGIGSEEQNGEYLIKLEANSSTCPWAELLQKKDQWALSWQNSCNFLLLLILIHENTKFF